MPSTTVPGLKKSTEKYIRAEQKNRLERTRLELTHKFFDREKFRTRHVIDREKKLVVRGFDNVRRTSGYSDEGLEPTGVNDRAYKKAHVYKTGLRLSENRLTTWRNHEKDLERFLEREMEKNRPKSSKVRFSISHGPTKPKGPPEKVGSPPQPKRSSLKSSISSHFLDDVSDEEASVFSDSEESSTGNASCGSVRIRPSTGGNPDHRRLSKKVTFQRPHTAGTALRGNQVTNNPTQRRLTLSTESAKDSIEHFLITKGDVLMNKGGKYHKLHSHAFHCGTDGSVSTPKYKRGERLEHSPNRSSLYSPVSDMMSELSDEELQTNLSSSMTHLALPSRVPLGRPNSRLGIFLPPEQEFGRRRISANKGKDSTETYCDIWVGKIPDSPPPSNDWKRRLMPTASATDQIRSMTSLSTVLRAAMAFSRSRRRGILQDILKEKDYEEQEMKKHEKRRRDTLYLHVSADMGQLPTGTRENS